MYHINTCNQSEAGSQNDQAPVASLRGGVFADKMSETTGSKFRRIVEMLAFPPFGNPWGLDFTAQEK